jgi:hypothetical protein
VNDPFKDELWIKKYLPRSSELLKRLDADGSDVEARTDPEMFERRLKIDREISKLMAEYRRERGE